MKKLTLALLALTLSAGAFAANNQYCNGRFQFCVDYPPYLKRGAGSDNGDGVGFIYPKHKANIGTFAQYLVLHDSFAEFVKDAKEGNKNTNQLMKKPRKQLTP